MVLELIRALYLPLHSTPIDQLGGDERVSNEKDLARLILSVCQQLSHSRSSQHVARVSVIHRQEARRSGGSFLSDLSLDSYSYRLLMAVTE